MTKQEIIDLIVRKGEDEIDINGNGLFTMLSTEIVYIADEIIARQDERLKEFVEWLIFEHNKQSYIIKKLKTPMIEKTTISYYNGRIKQVQLDMCLFEKYLEKFLEETSND